MIKAEHAQTKSGNGLSDTVGYYHRSKLCCLGIHTTIVQTSFTCFHIRKQMPHPPSFGMGHKSVYLVYSYNTQTFHKSWYQQVYVSRIIKLQLIYCIYFIQIPQIVLVTKTHLHVHKLSKNRNGPSTSQPTLLDKQTLLYCKGSRSVPNYTRCKIFHKLALKLLQ